MAQRERGGGRAEEFIGILVALVRLRRLRRQLMFLLCLAALLLVGTGFLPLRDWLEERPGWFLGYWGFTFLTVVLLMLVALYDILRTWRGERP